MTNFCTPSPLSLLVQMGPNFARPHPHHPWTLTLKLPTTHTHTHTHTPSPSPLVFLQKIGMLQRKTECNLEPSFLQNQTPVCQEHLQQNQTPARNNVWTRVTLMLTIAVDIQFLWIPSPCNHPLSSEFLSFFNWPSLPPSTGCNKCIVP